MPTINPTITTDNTPAIEITIPGGEITYEQLLASFSSDVYGLHYMFYGTLLQSQFARQMSYKAYNPKGNTLVTSLLTLVDPQQFQNTMYLDISEKGLYINGQTFLKFQVVAQNLIQFVFWGKKISTDDMGGIGYPGGAQMAEGAVGQTDTYRGVEYDPVRPALPVAKIIFVPQTVPDQKPRYIPPPLKPELKRRLFFFNIQNNTSSDIPITLFNADQPDNTVNATTRYRWDITGVSYANPSITFLARTVYQSVYKTYNTSATSNAGLIAALNSLHIGTFWLATESGNTYVETYNDMMVYGPLVIGAVSSALTIGFNASAPLDTLAFTIDGTGTLFGFIDYGDGTIEGFSQAGPVNFSHAYATAGNYAAIVYVNDATVITELSASNTNISSLSGLNNFTNLSVLTLNGTIITSLDISANTLLDSLSIQNSVFIPGLLTTLDVTQNILLTNIQITRHAGLTGIDISQNTLLDSLAIQNCALTTIDISANPLILSCLLSVNKLSVAAVNSTLISLDGFGLLNGTCALFGQVPAAAPTGAGATAKANLITNGWVVTTD